MAGWQKSSDNDLTRHWNLDFRECIRGPDKKQKKFQCRTTKNVRVVVSGGWKNKDPNLIFMIIQIFYFLLFL